MGLPSLLDNNTFVGHLDKFVFFFISTWRLLFSLTANLLTVITARVVMAFNMSGILVFFTNLNLTKLLGIFSALFLYVVVIGCNI